MKDHLSREQRNNIRYTRATEQGMARKYGISVSLVRQVKAGAQRDHPARLAAIARRKSSADAFVAKVSRSTVPATSVAAPKGQLHVEGGADLPAVLV